MRILFAGYSSAGQMGPTRLESSLGPAELCLSTKVPYNSRNTVLK